MKANLAALSKWVPEKVVDHARCRSVHTTAGESANSESKAKDHPFRLDGNSIPIAASTLEVGPDRIQLPSPTTKTRRRGRPHPASLGLDV